MDEQVKPLAQSNVQEITCTQCGRYVGPLPRCPHCGARQPQRISLRVLRLAAVLLATVGLFLLWLMAIHREIPLIKIADIQPTMNFALVRVAGQATGDARTFREAGKIRSLRFMVIDGTGDLAVNAYGKAAEQMALYDRIPRAGDPVEVTGSLTVSADENVSLRMQSGDALKLQRAEKVTPPLADVKNVAEGAQTMITGAVTRVIAPRTGSRAPYVVTVRDATEERQLVIWSSVFEKVTDRERLVPGAAVRAKVTAETYKGKTQLKLGRAADLEILPEAAKP
jgi:uncharacterized OB-fold protein